MEKFPKIKTDRLTLTEITTNDIPEIVEFAGNINITKNTLNIPHPYTKDDAIFWINKIKETFENKTSYTFGIRLNSTDNFIGAISLGVNSKHDRGELGYWIAEPYWNNGYATEAVAAIMDFGFNKINLHKIYAQHLIENPASGVVMKKNGMIKEGVLKDRFKKDGCYRTVVQYRLIKNEFYNTPLN